MLKGLKEASALQKNVIEKYFANRIPQARGSLGAKGSPASSSSCHKAFDHNSSCAAHQVPFCHRGTLNKNLQKMSPWKKVYIICFLLFVLNSEQQRLKVLSLKNLDSLDFSVCPRPTGVRSRSLPPRDGLVSAFSL